MLIRKTWPANQLSVLATKIRNQLIPLNWDMTATDRIKLLLNTFVELCPTAQWSCEIEGGGGKLTRMILWLFSHDGKVRILNSNSKCAFWIKIRKTVFWTVCTPNHIAMRNLKCAFQMMVRTMIWIAHFKLRIAMWFGVHTVQNTVIRIIIWIAHFKLHIAMWFWRTHGPKYCLSNFNSKCVFRIKIQNTHFAVVWKQSLCILYS